MSAPGARDAGDPSLAVAYLRVSTDDQALGPEAQRAAIGAWAAREGIDIVATTADIGVSGGAELDRRPGMLEAVRLLGQHGAGSLLVAKRDRLARDIVIAAAIESLVRGKGARVLSADGMSDAAGPEGELMRGIVDLFAQYERALIRSRVTAALGVKRSRGERTGSVPLGYRCAADGVKLEESAAEQRAANSAVELRAAGKSVRSIARWLDEHGPNPRGKRWHPTTVARMLERARG